MAAMKDRVYGYRAAPPRPTWAALRVLLLYVAAPMMTALVAFDIVVWWVARTFFDACAAIWCWF